MTERLGQLQRLPAPSVHTSLLDALEAGDVRTRAIACIELWQLAKGLDELLREDTRFPGATQMFVRTDNGASNFTYLPQLHSQCGPSVGRIVRYGAHSHGGSKVKIECPAVCSGKQANRQHDLSAAQSEKLPTSAQQVIADAGGACGATTVAAYMSGKEATRASLAFLTMASWGPGGTRAPIRDRLAPAPGRLFHQACPCR